MNHPRAIFDSSLLAQRVRRARPEFVSRLVWADLHDRLGLVTRDIEKAALITPDPDAMGERSATANGPVALECFALLEITDADQGGGGGKVVLPADDYQLIVSLLDLQIVNDVPGFLASIKRHLAPDGLFMAAAIGGRTLTELREAWLAADVEGSGGVVPRVAPMIDVRDAGALLQHAGFALPVTDLETHTVRYDTPLALFEDLRAMGASNPLIDRPKNLTARGRVMRAAEIYAERFSDPDGKVRATLEILWLSGWAPHESQQKPLKPGSAQKSLRDVLGDKG